MYKGGIYWWKIILTIIQIVRPNRIIFYVGKQRAHSPKVEDLAPILQKSDTEQTYLDAKALST